MFNDLLKLIAVAGIAGGLCPACDKTSPVRDEGRAAETPDVDKAGDACGFTGPVPLGSPDPSGMVAVPPAHPYIRYLGRIDCADPEALRMAHPGAQIKVRFEGERIGMRLRDFGIEEYPNYYSIIIDGGETIVLRMSPEQEQYTLAEGLGPGVHEITVFKRTESSAAGNGNSGKGVFLGLLIPDGATLHPPPPVKHPVIEVIGDSITCGYGNGVSTFAPAYFPYSTKGSDNTLAYGAVAARMLDAAYVPIAYSGRGVVRNWAGFEGKTLPEMYFEILPDDPDPGRWDVNRFAPDIVVVNLGTNDFSVGLAPSELAALRADYERGYDLFLETLRRYHPDALIILAVGPMVSDDYPAGYFARSSILGTLSRLIRKRRGSGDDRVLLLEHAPQTPPFGEDWHPTAARHRIMAEELVQLIRSYRASEVLDEIETGEPAGR